MTGAFIIPQAIASVFADTSSRVSVTPQGHVRSLLSILDSFRCVCVIVCLCALPCRQFETVIPTEDSVITEITMTLRDWGTMWKQLYMVNITLCAALNKCSCFNCGHFSCKFIYFLLVLLMIRAFSNRILDMLGRFFYLNKMKTKRISNHMSQHFIHNRA